MSHRLPSAPILARLDREVDRRNWTLNGVDDALEGLAEVCALIGVSRRSVNRWRNDGEMTFAAADRVLTGLGLEHHWHEPELAPYYATPAPPPRVARDARDYKAEVLRRTEGLDDWQFEQFEEAAGFFRPETEEGA